MSNEVLTQYKRYRARNRRFISAMVLLLAVTGIVSLIIGSHRIGWQELWAIVQNEGTEMNRQILLNIRLPRMLAAVITGIILSLSGAIMQILLRNPLASPYTLGISNAAAFGASFGIVFLGAGAGITRSSDLFMITNPYVITLSAFLGSLLGLAIILIIIRGKQASVETIILSGVIINSLFGAGIGYGHGREVRCRDFRRRRVRSRQRQHRRRIPGPAKGRRWQQNALYPFPRIVSLLLPKSGLYGLPVPLFDPAALSASLCIPTPIFSRSVSQSDPFRGCVASHCRQKSRCCSAAPGVGGAGFIILTICIASLDSSYTMPIYISPESW